MKRKPFGLVHIPIGPFRIVIQNRRPRIRWYIKGGQVR